ncbi:MAG: TonB-dependent receptor [Saprospiraceae bacterium]
MRYCLFGLFLIAGLHQQLSAQIDSLLTFRELGYEDLFFSDDEYEKQEFLSASRTVKNIGELPFSVYIISKEEIQRNGYVTLVDALKTVPGIRVSQPGSALEGETFMMRGLIGNQYAKILINDVPIKPTALLGMPIGAQLPIKQAERIEIIFGPAASIYGADASAGVINIITRESERPVYVNADLSFGGESFRSLNLLLGGKMGRGKNIIKFSLFGSNTTFNDRRIIYDSIDIYGYQNYFRDEMEFNKIRSDGLMPNYVSFQGSPLPRFGSLPHASRTFGANVKWRNFTVFYENLYRSDHSALGFNPTAISYSNPQTSTAETLNRTSIAWNLERKYWGTRTMLNVLSADSDYNSSANYNFNVLARIVNQSAVVAARGDQMVLDSLQNIIRENFLTGNRYKGTFSDEVRLEHLVNFYPGPNLEVTLGGQVLLNNYENFDYLERPGNTYVNIPANKFFSQTTFDASLFAQGYYTSRFINVVGGVQAYLPDGTSWQISPRIATILKWNQQFSTRLFYGRAFRQPSPYYQYKSYFADGDSFWAQQNINLELAPEITDSYEIGARWISESKKTRAELTYFNNKTNNLISFDQVVLDANNPESRIFGIGYTNFGESFAALQGVQASLYFKNLIPFLELHGGLHAQYVNGKEELPGRGELDMVRGQPAWTIQLQQELKIARNWYLHLSHVYQSETLSRRLSNLSLFQQNQEQYEIPGYYTLDAVVRVKLTDNFQVYTRFNNVFNKSILVLMPRELQDDLIRNPQSDFGF